MATPTPIKAHLKNSTSHVAAAAVDAGKPDRKPTAEPVAPAPAAAVDPPRPMAFEDRRIIFEKLNEVYVDPNVGYADEWTDKRVADDLGVPLAWVTKIRAENFGPHGSNKAIDQVVAKAEAIIADCRVMSHKLLATADDLERRLVDIQKSVRP